MYFLPAFCVALAALGQAMALSPPVAKIKPPPPVSRPVGKIPRPVVDCGDDIENLKFHKESCKEDKECFGGPTSMICKDKTCQCAENYEPEERFVGEKATQTVCSPAPYLFTKCKTGCQKPATCQAYTGDDAKGKDIKLCMCAKPYVFEDGVCYLTCGKDEIYDSTQYKCVPKCKETEVKVNGTCKPLVNLKGKCETDKQCLPSFSECKSGVCSCRDGFNAVKDSTCSPKTVVCPAGEPLKDGSSYKPCRTAPASRTTDDDSAPSGPTKRRDDCPDGHFCLVTSSGYAQADSAGFCCPRLRTDCPLGRAHPTARCRTGGLDRGADDAAKQEYCPWDTHYCYGDPFGAGGAGGREPQTCCPKGCPTDAVIVGDQCYPRSKLGERCTKKEQCVESHSECTGGVCKCRSPAKAQGSPNYPYCVLECKPDEVLNDNKCHKRSKLSDPCKKAEEWRCPQNGYCNKNNQCACQCGMFTLAENTCAPPPVCHPPRPFPIVYSLGADARAGAPPPPPVLQISEEEREKLLKNATFCAVKDRPSPSKLKVGSCSGKTFCSYYVPDVGLCCPKPESVCPGGAKPISDKRCNIKDPLSCGWNGSCVRLYYPVDKDDKESDSAVCCPKYPSEELAE